MVRHTQVGRKSHAFRIWIVAAVALLLLIGAGSFPAVRGSLPSGMLGTAYSRSLFWRAFTSWGVHRFPCALRERQRADRDQSFSFAAHTHGLLCPIWSWSVREAGNSCKGQTRWHYWQAGLDQERMRREYRQSSGSGTSTQSCGFHEGAANIPVCRSSDISRGKSE